MGSGLCQWRRGRYNTIPVGFPFNYLFIFFSEYPLRLFSPVVAISNGMFRFVRQGAEVVTHRNRWWLYLYLTMPSWHQARWGKADTKTRAATVGSGHTKVEWGFINLRNGIASRCIILSDSVGWIYKFLLRSALVGIGL